MLDGAHTSRRRVTLAGGREKSNFPANGERINGSDSTRAASCTFRPLHRRPYLAGGKRREPFKTFVVINPSTRQVPAKDHEPIYQLAATTTITFTGETVSHTPQPHFAHLRDENCRNYRVCFGNLARGRRSPSRNEWAGDRTRTVERYLFFPSTA